MVQIMKYKGKDHQYFETGWVKQENAKSIEHLESSELLLLWFDSDGNTLVIDNVTYIFNQNDIVCLTEFHKVEVKRLSRTRFIKWNKYFYCIINHDSEVGCKGVLFYGAFALPVIHLADQDAETLLVVWKMLAQEMISQDSLQEEMLQMMLKRILILCTRIYKEQNRVSEVEKVQFDIVREYHFLVEMHFREKHTVNEYAEMLFKSPKTLSNLFKKLESKSPLQFIKDRKMLEARRLLSYTEKTISEIGYELGFSEIQAFSRFFKKEEGISPKNFKKKYYQGKNG